MRYLGLSQVREWISPSPSLNDQFAADGFRFDFQVPGGQYLQPPATVVSWFNGFAGSHPGSIVSLEGLNEIDNFPVAYKGQTGTAAGVSYQTDVYAAAKASPAVAGLPLINLSLGTASPSAYGALGNMSPEVDWGNVHRYPQAGTEPGLDLPQILRLESGVTPGKPIAVTELGYSTMASDATWGVDQTTQAKLLLNALMDAQHLGIASLYIYELADNKNSGTGSWSQLGLFDASLKPKVSAAAIHNLTSVLTNGGGGAWASAPGYTVSGLDGYNQSLEFHKANGAYDLVVWREPSLWIPKTHSEVSNPAETANVFLSAPVTGYSVYDPMRGATATSSGGVTDTISLQVSDHPVIVELGAPLTGPNIVGGAGNDVLSGSGGADIIQAGAGNDTVYGTAAFDSIVGGAGDDRLYGNGGSDALTGGAGRDWFVFDTAPSIPGVAHITDFTPSDDQIYLDHAIYTGAATGVMSASTFSAHIHYNSADGDLSYDGAIFAHLTPGLSLSPSNFVVY